MMMISYFQKFAAAAVVTIMICTHPWGIVGVSGQFRNCDIQDATMGDNGTMTSSSSESTTVCAWETHPLVMTDFVTGTEIEISNSQLFSICTTGTLMDVSNCACAISIPDADDTNNSNATVVYDENDACTSCTLLVISEISYTIHFDCSNRQAAVDGDCPIYNANGCQTTEQSQPVDTTVGESVPALPPSVPIVATTTPPSPAASFSVAVNEPTVVIAPSTMTVVDATISAGNRSCRMIVMIYPATATATTTLLLLYSVAVGIVGMTINSFLLGYY